MRAETKKKLGKEYCDYYTTGAAESATGGEEKAAGKFGGWPELSGGVCCLGGSLACLVSTGR